MLTFRVLKKMSSKFFCLVCFLRLPIFASSIQIEARSLRRKHRIYDEQFMDSRSWLQNYLHGSGDGDTIGSMEKIVM